MSPPQILCTEFKLSQQETGKKLKLLCQAIGFAMISNLPTSNAIAATTLQADIFPKVMSLKCRNVVIMRQ